MGKKIVKKIPAEILHNAQLLLDEVNYSLRPYVISLTQPERQTLSKIETASIKFLEVSHEIASRSSELFPAFMKTVVFCEEFSIACELWALISKIDELKEIINDTELLAGNYALDEALAFYHTVKIAAQHDIPAARVIYEELKPAYSIRKWKLKKVNMVKDEKQPELFEDRKT